VCTRLICGSTLTTNHYSLNVLVTFLQLCGDVFPEYSGDCALQAMPPDLKIRQPKDILFRIFIGYLTVWKSSLYNHAAKQPYYSKLHYLMCVLNVVLWLHESANLLERNSYRNPVQSLSWEYSWVTAVCWVMYCNAVSESVSLYCKDTYVMGVQEAGGGSWGNYSPLGEHVHIFVLEVRSLEW
jgi:hypothetical protein